MKKSVLLSLVLVFSVSLTGWAANAETDRASSLRELRVTPDTKIVSLMQQYQVMRSKSEKLSRTFRNVHSAYSASGAGNMEGLPEDRFLVIIRPSLGVIKNFLQIQDDAGEGNVSYWLQTYTLNSAQGKYAVVELSRLLKKCGTNINPLLRAAIQNVARSLLDNMERYDGESGAVGFWVDKSAFVRTSMHQAAANLDVIINTLPNVANADPMEIIRAHAGVVARILQSQKYNGEGNVDYWFRSYELLNRQAGWGGDSLRTLVVFTGDKVMPLLKNSIRNVANNLDATYRKHQGSSGNVDFWSQVCSFVCDGMYRASADLRQVLDAI